MPLTANALKQESCQNMNLDFDSYEDWQSLSGVTLAEEPEVNVEQDDLLGAATNFHWRIRITPPATRRFSLSPYTRNHEVIVKLSYWRLPSTAAASNDYLSSHCPDTGGRAFRLRCYAWPPSPYSIMPVKFSEELLFGAGQETSETNNAVYQNLIKGCQQFARQSPGQEVEFEVKILFSKKVEVVAKG